MTPEWKVFHDSVVSLPDEPGLTTAGIFQNGEKPEDMAARMTLVFALRPAAERQDELEAGSPPARSCRWRNSTSATQYPRSR
jgi:hypothetical protein